MTSDEKNSQMGTTPADAIDRLGVEQFFWWNEALHGVASSPGVSFAPTITEATSFPQIISMGATFDLDLAHSMAQVISTEARAFANDQQSGETFFTPNINVYRDPRWGRGQETVGEDPFWMSEYVVALVTGLQEDTLDPDHLKIGVTCKHFIAYDLEDFDGVDRHHFDALVTDRDMFETYAPPFKACVQRADVESVMCSYNSVNGVPMCANGPFLNGLLRDEWGFDGYVVSDCAAIDDIWRTHEFVEDAPAAAAAAIRGGCDLSCGREMQDNNAEALARGILSEDDVDQALVRLMRTRIRLGDFDDKTSQPFKQIGAESVDTPEARALALRAAQEAMVLLQNNDDVLPLDASLSSIAVVGPHFDATTDMQGNYNGIAPFLVSPLDGITTLVGPDVTVTSAQGTDIDSTDTSGFAAAVAAASGADATVVVLGINQSIERESFDRTEISMPGNQFDLLEAVSAAATGPVILVVMSGGPVDLAPIVDIVDAIIWAGYPGQSGGTAIAQVLFGEVNPSGRLPYTMYPADYVDQISFFDMSMRDAPGRTYKFYTGDAAFGFGDGLSYTTFDAEIGAGNTADAVTLQQVQAGLSVTATITNSGDRAGDHVMLAFRASDVADAPIRQLFAFDRVTLDAGESVTITVPLSVEDFFSQVNEAGAFEIMSGTYEIQIGDARRSLTLLPFADDAELAFGMSTSAVVLIVVLALALFTVAAFVLYRLRSSRRDVTDGRKGGFTAVNGDGTYVQMMS